jgi:threonine/homoserine/homoserine lactone efflux protein
MLGTHDFGLFLASGIMLNLLPGPDTLYIVGRSLAQGRRAGVVSALGISTGCLVHTTAAAFGLSAILAASALAFGLVKWLGVAYLTYLGVQLLLPQAAAATDGEAKPERIDLATIYRQGLITNVLNPKVAMFFLAFLPQFVSPERAASPLPFLFLGGVFIFTGTLWCVLLAILAGAASQLLRSRSSAPGVMRRLTGLLFLGLGLRLATQEAR